MSRLSAWLTRTAEKFAGSFYEGPEMPDRLAQMVTVFANMNRRATRTEWAEFAREHAREAYRSGFIRGAERVERASDETLIEAPMSPEAIADLDGPDWRWLAVNPDLSSPVEIVTDEAPDEPSLIVEQMREMENTTPFGWRGPVS